MNKEGGTQVSNRQSGFKLVQMPSTGRCSIIGQANIKHCLRVEFRSVKCVQHRAGEFGLQVYRFSLTGNRGHRTHPPGDALLGRVLVT